MNNRLVRILILLSQLLIMAFVAFICVYAMVLDIDSSLMHQYIAGVGRVVVVLLITVAYYRTSVSRMNPGNPFLIMCFLFLALSELRIIYYFTLMTGWSLIPPRALVRTVMGAQFMAHFTLIGYGVHYQNNEHNAMIRSLLIGMAAVVFVSIIIPSAQSLNTLWCMPAPFLILCIFAATTLVVHLILLFSEPSVLGAMRHVGTILMITGSFISLVYGSAIVANIVGSALFALGGLVTMIITLRNSVLL